MTSKQSTAFKFIYLVFTVLLLSLPQNMQGQNKKRKKNKDKDKTEIPTPKKEKTIEQLTKNSSKKEGLFTIYQDTITGSLRMLISKDQIGKEYIYFSQIADGVMDAGRINRGSYNDSKVFKIEKYFNKIEFITQPFILIPKARFLDLKTPILVLAIWRV